MKKYLAILICALLCITLLVSCNKECYDHVDENGDGFCDICNFEYEFLFKLTADESGYELDRVGAGYEGGDVVLPSKHKGLPIIQIGSGAFKSEKKLTSVVIPDSVTLIDGDAFENQTSLTNYFVICEGRSSTHIISLADELDERLSELGCAPLHSEGYETANWVVLDFASVIVHIFDRTTREFYNLENLWRDGTEIDVSELLIPDGEASLYTVDDTEE